MGGCKIILTIIHQIVQKKIYLAFINLNILDMQLQ